MKTRSIKKNSFITRIARLAHDHECSAYPIMYWPSIFVCYFFLLIVAISICLLASPPWSIAVVTLIIGLGLDVYRWNRAPDLTKSLQERHDSLRTALLDSKFSDFCAVMFRRYLRVYWLWWVFVLVMLTTRLFRFDLPIELVRTLYPILNPTSLYLTFRDHNRADLALKFFSITWYFMVAAIIAEVAGGAFYYIHKRKDRLSGDGQSLVKMVQTNKWTPFFLFVMLCGTYGMIYFTTATRPGVSTADAPIGPNHPVPEFMFRYILLINGLGLVSTAGVLRFLYAYFLIRISSVRPLKAREFTV